MRRSFTLSLAAATLLGAAFPIPAAAEPEARKAADVFMKEDTFTMSRPDDTPRLTVGCPGGKTVIPLGGGMFSSPSPGTDGEGVYPHSFERLGAQSGWHVTPVFYDPSPASSTPRQVTLQVICGPKTRSIVAIRRTVFVQPGEEASASATCSGGRRLFGGGFQRTNFVTGDGNYVTSSGSSSDRTWTVTGSAFGSFGGEMTAIAYCRASRKPILTEVSATSSVPPGSYGTAATPPCPGNLVLVSGGHSVFPAKSSLFADGFVNSTRGWTAGVYNAFGPAAIVTARGYCHSPNFPRARKGEAADQSVVAPVILQRAEKALISERVNNGGCYPAPPALANGIRARTGLNTATAPGPGAVRRGGTVYVLTGGASCDRARIAARVRGRAYTINSATGTVRVK